MPFAGAARARSSLKLLSCQGRNLTTRSFVRRGIRIGGPAMQGIAPSEARSRNCHNFSGGPGALPEPVLEQARDAIIGVPDVGLSVLGISHRSQWFRDVVDEAEENFRLLLGLKQNYRVLFLQGGGSLQFSMIPMSFLRGRRNPADYLVSG